jgi:hypothetical protein
VARWRKPERRQRSTSQSISLKLILVTRPADQIKD